MRRKTIWSAVVITAYSLFFLCASPIPQTNATVAGTKPSATQKAKAKTAKDLVDLNSATKDELSAIFGIGDTYSQTIIDNRPYKAKTDLVKKKVIPQATYKKVANRVIAKASNSPTGAADSSKGELRRSNLSKARSLLQRLRLQVRNQRAQRRSVRLPLRSAPTSSKRSRHLSQSF